MLNTTEAKIVHNFSVTSETHEKIIKTFMLSSKILSNIEKMFVDFNLKNNCEVYPEVQYIIEYEYISEKQYKDILSDLTDKKIMEVSNLSKNAVVPALMLEMYAKKTSTTFNVSILGGNNNLIPLLLRENYYCLYNKYMYVVDILELIFIESIRLNKKQMEKLNIINKEISQCMKDILCDENNNIKSKMPKANVYSGNYITNY